MASTHSAAFPPFIFLCHPHDCVLAECGKILDTCFLIDNAFDNPFIFASTTFPFTIDRVFVWSRHFPEYGNLNQPIISS